MLIPTSMSKCLLGIEGQFRVRECNCIPLVEPIQPSYAIVTIIYINPDSQMMEKYTLESVGEVKLNGVTP